VKNQFPDNYGTIDDFNYPVTHADARAAVHFFLREKLCSFGTYQDAIHNQETFLFHSVLTPVLNTGLLTPQYIMEETLQFAAKNKVALNNLEGFIRQIIGWREFMRGMYDKEGVFQRTRNFFGFHRKIPACFYTASTGIAPVDDSIRKVLKHGYCHHIERLMVLGNFMLLCEFHPDEVYRWFMELFVDAYDWVMVPNVYGMSQYADGGLITTKPYISSSNYILKMSNYKKGSWCRIWDALFWRFIIANREVFENNHRMSMMVALTDKMPAKKRNQYVTEAEKFLKTF
jgi:deoxyribodipyrimidine photolyase-related protein